MHSITLQRATDGEAFYDYEGKRFLCTQNLELFLNNKRPLRRSVLTIEFDTVPFDGAKMVDLMWMRKRVYGNITITDSSNVLINGLIVIERVARYIAETFNSYPDRIYAKIKTTKRTKQTTKD